MNGNQITISVNSDEFNQLRTIARTRGQTVSDYISYLVSSNLLKSSTTGAQQAPASAAAATIPATKHSEPTLLKPARARVR